MNTWNKSYTRNIEVLPDVIWDVLADTAHWKEWNAGVKSIQIDGDFVTGTRFVMELPDGMMIHSQLISVIAPEHFIDESKLDDTIIQVEHRIEPVGKTTSRVTYAIGVQGANAQVIGEAVSEDFPSVLECLDKYITQKG